MSKSIFVILFILLTSCIYSQTRDTTINEEAIYETVDSVAHFPGGNEAMIRFFNQNIDASVPVEKNAKKGTYKVKIKFTVTKEGLLRDFEPLTNYKHDFEDEVIRVLKLSPKWIPAIKNNVNVNSKAVKEQVFVISVM